MADQVDNVTNENKDRSASDTETSSKNNTNSKIPRKTISDKKHVSCLNNIKICPCNHRSLLNNIERSYKYKLICQDASIDNRYILDVYVLANDICVLQLNSNVFQHPFINIPTYRNGSAVNSRLLPGKEIVKFYDILSFRYLIKFHDHNIHGKRKKGSLKLKAGDELFEIRLGSVSSESNIMSDEIDDGQTLNEKVFRFITPIGGQLLEINHEFEANPKLLFDQTNQSSFTAIMYPTLTLPSMELFKELTNSLDSAGTTNNNGIYLDKIVNANSSGGQNGLCFQWMKSQTCNRGDNCKFSHSQ